MPLAFAGWMGWNFNCILSFFLLLELLWIAWVVYEHRNVCGDIGSWEATGVILLSLLLPRCGALQFPPPASHRPLSVLTNGDRQPFIFGFAFVVQPLSHSYASSFFKEREVFKFLLAKLGFATRIQIKRESRSNEVQDLADLILALAF